MIKVLSRNEAMMLLSRPSLQEHIIGNESAALISISCVKDATDSILEQHPGLDMSSEMVSLFESKTNKTFTKFLPLYFLDIMPREDEHRLDDYLMTEEDANEIIQFIEETKDMPLVVHCTAGISRSGAVGAYASIVRDEEKEFWAEYEKYIHPNNHVLSLLKRHLFKGE